MKKLISMLLLAVLLLQATAIGSFAASDAYKATWTLKTSVMDAAANQADDKAAYQNAAGLTVYNSTSTPTVSVYPGQVVWVTIHLKTGSSYYVGAMQGLLYYSSGIFESTTQTAAKSYVWNTAGAFTSKCTVNGAPYSKVLDVYKPGAYPEAWSQQKKDSTEFYTVTMYLDANKTTTAIAGINEDLVTVPIYVKASAKPGETGSVFLTDENMKSKDNPAGNFILSYYEKGDMHSSLISYSDKTSFDTSKASINFVVKSRSASGITLSDTSLNLHYKDTAALTATVKGVSKPNITWTSSNPKVATVDANGNVTATGKGTATITASYGGASEECTVNVSYTFLQQIIRIVLFGWIWY